MGEKANHKTYGAISAFFMFLFAGGVRTADDCSSDSDTGEQSAPYLTSTAVSLGTVLIAVKQ